MSTPIVFEPHTVTLEDGEVHHFGNFGDAFQFAYLAAQYMPETGTYHTIKVEES